MREEYLSEPDDVVGTYLHEYPIGFNINMIHSELNTCIYVVKFLGLQVLLGEMTL